MVTDITPSCQKTCRDDHVRGFEVNFRRELSIIIVIIVIDVADDNGVNNNNDIDHNRLIRVRSTP